MSWFSPFSSEYRTTSMKPFHFLIPICLAFPVRRKIKTQTVFSSCGWYLYLWYFMYKQSLEIGAKTNYINTTWNCYWVTVKRHCKLSFTIVSFFFQNSRSLPYIVTSHLQRRQNGLIRKLFRCKIGFSSNILQLSTMLLGFLFCYVHCTYFDCSIQRTRVCWKSSSE